MVVADKAVGVVGVVSAPNHYVGAGIRVIACYGSVAMGVLQH